MILVLANGNLNGRVARLTADHLHRVCGAPVRLIRTLDLTRWPEEAEDPYVLEPEFVTHADAESLLPSASAFVYTASWEDRTSRLARKAHDHGVSTVCVVADLGYGIEKLGLINDRWMPSVIAVPDPVTHQMLLKTGIPSARIHAAGSPYFDRLAMTDRRFAAGDEHRALKVGVLLSPEPSSVERGVATAGDYAQADALSRVMRALSSATGVSIQVRPHPKMPTADIDRILDDGAGVIADQCDRSIGIEKFCARQDIVVGTRSLGLLVARAMGARVISFQPVSVGAGSREEIYTAWGIPIARDERQLRALLSSTSEGEARKFDLSARVYNAGTSLMALSRRILDVARRANPGSADDAE